MNQSEKLFSKYGFGAESGVLYVWFLLDFLQELYMDLAETNLNMFCRDIFTWILVFYEQT
jgi:hypothetical protein